MLLNCDKLVVVGDQSSGKSSVLESLTGFSFPRDTGLCTRYATQITCRRESQKSISISIIPSPTADAARKEKLKGFYRHVDHIHGQAFDDIFREASEVMGIRMSSSQEDDALSTFSEDILKIGMVTPLVSHTNSKYRRTSQRQAVLAFAMFTS